MGDDMIDMGKMVIELKRDEGFRDLVYECSAGKLTICYGHNVEDNPIPESIATDLLQHDIMTCVGQCQKWPWFLDLSETRQRAIVNMVFNIGFKGVSRFRRMIAAIEQKDFNLAAFEMMNSHWYNQVGARANTVPFVYHPGYYLFSIP